MLSRTIAQHARNAPHKPALIHNGRIWSYAEFARRIERSRQHFAAALLPVQQGRIVVLAIESLAEAWVQGIALRSLGFTTVCLPSDNELGSLKLEGIDSVVTTAQERSGSLATAAAARGWSLHLAPELAARPAGATGPAADAPGVQSEAGHVLMTSGTTGDFKMVLRDAATEAANVPRRADFNGIDGDSVVYAGEFLKLTAGGYHWPLMTWTMGGTVVFHQAADPYLSLQRQPLTHAFATPSTLVHLLRAPPGALRRQEHMRLMVTGGALPRALAKAAFERLTPRVFSVFASTEALTVAITPVEAGVPAPWHLPPPARGVQVVDEADQPLPPGRMGLVRVRILDGLEGYLGDPEASRRFFRDGYFYSGDLGTLDAEGRLTLQGRVTEIINALGSKIAPAALEQQMQDALGAAGVCLLTVPDADGEEKVHVVIEPGPGFRRETLVPVLETLLGQVFDEVRYHFSAELPRNHMGKVMRLRLQQQLQAMEARSPGSAS